jgi:hypothetical protein
MGDTVTRVVTGVDTYCWITGDPEKRHGRQYNSAERGETIEVSEKEAARGDELGFLSVPEDAEAALESNAEPEVWSPKSDDEIAGLTVEDTLAYLGQVPEDQHDAEVERVLDLEQDRDKPRAGILQLGE